jgi:hypothetical protein
MAEYPIKISTEQGDFTFDKNENTKHVDKFMDINNVPVKLTHDEILAMHGHVSREKSEEHEEQAGKVGDVAVESIVEEPEKPKSREFKPGPATWHSRQAGKEGKHSLKVEVMGPSKKYPDGINPRNGKLYVELKTEDGTLQKNVLAERLEYPERPLAEGAAEARRIGEDMDAEADEMERRLDEILPPSKKELDSKREKTIEEKFDELKKESDQRFKELMEQIKNLSEAPTLVLKPEDGGSQKSKEAPGSGVPEQREIGDKVGDPGQVEHRAQLTDGTPVIFRRNGPNDWVYSRNGNLAKEWFPTSADHMKNMLGYEIISQIEGSQEPVPAGGAQGARIYQAGGTETGQDRGVPSSPEGGVPSQDTPEQKLENQKNKIKAIFDRLTATMDQGERDKVEEELGEELDKLYLIMQENTDTDDAAAAETPTDDVNDSEVIDENKGWWRRARDKTKSYLRNPIITAKTDTMNFITEKNPRKRRRNMLAVLAGGLLAGYLVSRGFHFGGGGPEHPTAGGLFPGEHGGPIHGNHGVEHEAFFNNSADGHRRTAMMLPEGLNPGHDAQGHEIIIDSQGNPVVSHAEAPDIARGSGVLSPKAAEVLHSKGYNVSYMHLQNTPDRNSQLYESVVT